MAGFAHRVGSLRRTDSVAIEGIADIRRSLAVRRSDANDPNRVISRTEIPHRSTMPYRGVLSFCRKQGGIGQ